MRLVFGPHGSYVGFLDTGMISEIIQSGSHKICFCVHMFCNAVKSWVVWMWAMLCRL
jgi:hypothetical protein